MLNDVVDFFFFMIFLYLVCIFFCYNCSECLLWVRSGS